MAQEPTNNKIYIQIYQIQLLYLVLGPLFLRAPILIQSPNKSMTMAHGEIEIKTSRSPYYHLDTFGWNLGDI